MMRKSIVVVFVLFATLFIFFKNPGAVHATEGSFYLRSTSRESYRCWAPSVLMQDQQFHILVTCRELIYPAGDTVFSYVLWAQPTDGSGPRRLGELGYGRLDTRINQPFNQLFVTTEQNPGVGKPTGPIVMRGNVETETFLDRPTSATPTIAGQEPTGDVTVTPAPGSASTGSRLATALRRAGLAAFLALLALIGLVFAITRSRG